MQDETVEIPVTKIRVGMRVDLESCPHLKDEPSADSEYAVVSYAALETMDCFGIGYDGIDIIGYDRNAKLKVCKECYKCWNCGTSVRYEDNLALDGTTLEHARENEFCKTCQELDDITHQFANGATVTKPGIVTITENGKKWVVSILAAE